MASTSSAAPAGEQLLAVLSHGPPPAGHKLALAHIASLHARLKAMKDQRPDLQALDSAIANLTDLEAETERLHTQAHEWSRELDEMLEPTNLPQQPAAALPPKPIAWWEGQLAKAIRSLVAERRRASEAEAALQGIDFAW